MPGQNQNYPGQNDICLDKKVFPKLKSHFSYISQAIMNFSSLEKMILSWQMDSAYERNKYLKLN